MMKRFGFAIGGAVLLASSLHAQQPARPPPRRPNSRRSTCSATRSACRSIPRQTAPFNPMSSNVKVYGAIYSAESCSYDPDRGVIVVPNRGVPQNVQANNAWISFINHDGSVHTARWIGIANPGRTRPQHAAARPQRAARQRHRQRHAVPRRSRRRHRARAIHRWRSCGRST